MSKVSDGGGGEPRPSGFPEIRVVPDVHVTDNDGAEVVPEMFAEHRGSTVLGSVSHFSGSDDEDANIFIPFSPRSYQKLLIREAQDKKKAEEKKNRVTEGRLVDGELKFDDGEGEDEEVLERDPSLNEGGPLPAYLAEEFPDEYLRKPIEEIDPAIRDKTFVVISKRIRSKNIYRFSATKSLFMFTPNNPWRRLMLMIATNQFFDYFIIITILVNMGFLALDQNAYSWLGMAEYLLTTIYTIELIIKVNARGFFIHRYTYLRDPWNWIDFIVILSALLTITLEETGFGGDDVGSIVTLRSFRVLRALKTVSVVPGLKIIISALLRSMKMLIEVVILKLFCMMVFALFALQVYLGVLRQKCVKNVEFGPGLTDRMYMEHIKNDTNWHMNNDKYVICGNATGAGGCPVNYTCLPGIGENPNWGYTTFDNFGWAMLNALQLITLDFWEDLYMHVIRASGPWNIVFFMMVVFFGSFYLVNMMLAVVNMSYEEEMAQAKKEKERATKDENRVNAKKLARSKEKKAQQKAIKKESNHLQVMSAVNGSNTASSTSLKSVGNGVIKVSSGSIKDDKAPLDEARIVDPTAQGKDNTTDKKKADSKKTAAKKKTDGSKSSTDTNKIMPDNSKTAKDDKKTKAKKSESKENLVNSSMKKEPLEGIDNPIVVTEDCDSIYSEESAGDPPVVIFKEEDEETSDRNCECCSRCPSNYILWLKIQNSFYKIVSDFFFELFITFMIILNVAFMAMEHYDMSETMTLTLQIANYIFTGIFTMEAILKLIALSKAYFKSNWNIFDLIIVFVSLLETSLERVQGLSAIKALRLLRLLRVFKLAQTWTTMRVLLSIILKSLGALGNLTLVLLIVAYIFAVIGQYLFSDKYLAYKFDPDPIPRWNFSDFFHSMMLIFRILCGEWIEPLWDCMRADGEICMVVFLPTLVIGNLMVLNLFLALLLNSFASDSKNNKSSDTKEDSKMKQGWAKLKKLFTKKKSNSVEPNSEDDTKKSIASIVSELRRQQDLEKGAPPDQYALSNGDLAVVPDKTKDEKPKTMDEAFTTDRKKYDEFKKAVDSSKAANSDSPKKSTGSSNKSEEDGDSDSFSPADGELADCFPCCYAKCPCCIRFIDTPTGERWTIFRKRLLTVTEHKAFEWFILVIIVASSISLIFDDIYLYRKPTLGNILFILDIVYAIIFCLEMILKMFALGLKKYFTSFWTVLDFCIVIISFVSIVADQLNLSQVSAFRVLRTLRALRPLRAISRWQGMKIVVNALMYAIPAIFNVLLVCLVFWFIFSIAGVQLFNGKFFKCIDEEGERIDADIVPNRTVCEAMIAAGHQYRWKNSAVTFDNVLQGLLALMQVATFEGWMEVMRDAIDSREVIGDQPKREASFASYAFFVVFIIFGSFFTLNLFIGVIIDNFNTLKKKYEGGYLDILLTTNQRNYYNTMKKLGNRKPQKTIKRPKNKFQGFFFDVSVSTKFELAVVILIFFNMVAMGVEHYHQPGSYDDALDIMNIIFTTIFTLEAIVKIIGMRWHYFRRAWNVFDFLIVILSVVGVVLDDLLRGVFVTPSLLRVVRVFRIGRVLRLIKVAKGIRKLLFALMISLPALFNICMLLFMIIFMYAVFFMTMFGNVKLTGILDDVTNFQTFGNSMLLLFRLTTAGGWNEVLEPLLINTPDCDKEFMTMPDGERVAVPGGDCGNSGLAIFFMVTFIFLTYLIIINMYIAVILENFSQAHEQEEVGITEDDFEMFYVVWERYDPHATQFIKYDQLSDFVADLDSPLGMPRPNEIALVAFDLQIYEGDRLHCLDILTALVQHVLGSVEMTEEFKEVKKQVEEKFHAAFPSRVQQTVLSTTMRRKKEDVAAKTLQRAWRKHRAASSIRRITEMAMDMKRQQTRMSMSAANNNSDRRLSQASSVAATGKKERPPSATSTNSIKTVSRAAQVRQQSSQGKRRLMVPQAADISLPSDNDIAL